MGPTAIFWTSSCATGRTAAAAYGGSIKNRVRLPVEVAEAVIGVWGPGRVGYGVSPNFSMFSMSDSTPAETFSHLAHELSTLRLGYLHVIEPVGGPMAAPLETRIAPALRGAFR